MTKRRRPPEDRTRRAFGPIGGEVRTRGDADEAAALAASWRAATGEGRTLTHGVHAYPARMHPEQARLLIERLAPPGGVVLDPFCGSGTVLIEAFARGRRAIGSDVHPLAVRLARLKSRRVPASARRRVEEAAARIAKTAARAGRARDEEPAAPPEALRWYAPHVLLELGAIGEGIAAREDARTREFLHFVLSSIVVKVSRRRSETDPRGGARDLPLGGTATLFAERAVELGRGLAQLERAAAPRAGAPPVAEPVVARADARAMPVADASVDLVLTSPPYLGTYDYAGLQDLRAAALGLDLADAAAREIGARRDAGARGARERYAGDLARVLAEARRVLRPGGACAVVVGDSIAGEATPVEGDRVTEAAAETAGLELAAAASQDRPALPPAPAVPRREHVLLFRRPAAR